MQKFSTEIETEKKEKKVITVWLDDETARLLNECGDEKSKHAYIVEEYRAQLIERKETRRHQSLEGMVECGQEIADENANVDETVLHNMDLKKLRKAIKTLEPQQKWLLKQLFVLGKSKTQIADELGVSKPAITHRLHKIFQRLKNYLI